MKNEKNELKQQTQNNKTINSVMPDLALLGPISPTSVRLTDG